MLNGLMSIVVFSIHVGIWQHHLSLKVFPTLSKHASQCFVTTKMDELLTILEECREKLKEV